MRPLSQLPPFTRRLGRKAVLPAGLLFLAGGMLWLIALITHSGYCVALQIAGLGIGLIGSVGTGSMADSLGADRQGGWGA
ncbi:hypothetical protein ABTY96_23195 [Streptomyces sp. NPDC096057]|uniref:hypothetical protein n=1 Tax=Streptomyces sp. NPDC096057 TaxID=3155543 RepID=UPI003332B525